MRKCDVRSPEQALAYMVNCTLATVSSMAMLKSRKKGEYNRQIRIAQSGIDWMAEMNIDPSGTRAEKIQDRTVKQWASQYEDRPEDATNTHNKRINWMVRYMLDEGFGEKHLEALTHIVGLMNDCKDSETEILAFAKQLRDKYAG